MGGSRGRSWAPPPMNGYEPITVNLALTGAVPSKGDNPAVPLTTEEIAADAVACALGLSPAGASRALAGSPTTGR